MSALSDADRVLSETEYLAFERDNDIRHEFLNGQVYAMSGASRAHNLICTNLVAALHPQLQGAPCEIYQSDMRVKIAPLYAYPDIAVVCDPPQFADDLFDTLLNPLLLVEVLSPSTEGFDRGAKFQLYREIEALREYLLIAQDKPRIERYFRQANGLWVLHDTVGLAASLSLESLPAQLKLTDLYARVRFESGDDA